jgi:SAM-dependent methyltransferase
MESCPNSIYGYTKNSSELIIKTYEKSIIIRTGWLFGGIQKTHNKFVELVINNLLSNTKIKGSNDFFGSPTYTYDLIEKMKDLISNNKFGIHHIVNSGFANGYDIALEIAKILQKPYDLIENVVAKDVPNASLNRSKSECLTTIYKENILRNWKKALNEYINKYLTKHNLIMKVKSKKYWTTRDTCRLCDSYDLYVFFILESTPPANHFMTSEIIQDIIPLSLSKCQNCNHIQLIEKIEPSYLYSNYLYLSSISDTMVTHLKKSVNRFVNIFKIKKTDHILEIGANEGICVKELLDNGFDNVIGIDPASNINKLHKLPIICDYFGSNIIHNNKIKNKKFKLIYSFHCCAHIENIQDVFHTIYKLLDEGGICIIEVGYFNEIFKQSNFDVIYHEHIDYHTCYVMNNFLKTKNMLLFDVVKINNIQSGSIQFYICKDNPYRRDISDNIDVFIKEEMSNKIFDINSLLYWKINIIKSVNEFNDIIIGLVNRGKKIGGYGASAKSTTFLYQCKMNNYLIKYIIDDNHLKQHKYTPGLHIPIKSREYICIEPLDYIIILSWNFTDDIVKIIKSYTCNIRIIIPFPKFQII